MFLIMDFPEIPDHFRVQPPKPGPPQQITRPSAADALLGPTIPTIGNPLPQAPQQPPEKSLVAKLEDCVSFGHKILGQKPQQAGSILQWLRRVRVAFGSVYGMESPLCKTLELEIKQAVRAPPWAGQLAQRVADLEAVLDHFRALGGSPVLWPSSQPSRAPSTRTVFVIHGHDEVNTLRLEKLVQREFKLEPIVILARAGMTRPLTDKFEEHAQTCSFAFALLTPDDEVMNQGQTYNQPRPNAIYEAGWFVGRLGKQRVVLLVKEGTKIHSDLDGVSQIRFAENIQDKFLEIQRELQAANLVP